MIFNHIKLGRAVTFKASSKKGYDLKKNLPIFLFLSHLALLNVRLQELVNEELDTTSLISMVFY